MAIPVTLQDALRQLNLTADEGSSRSAEISGFIADAAAWIEGYTGLILVARDVTEQFRGFGPVELKAWPIAPDAVAGVAYTDAFGSPIAITGARVDLSRRPARVLPGTGCFWPFRDARQLFTVTIRAGYEDNERPHGNVRRAMLVLIAAYDADREGGDVFTKAEATARALCDRANLRLRRV